MNKRDKELNDKLMEINKKLYTIFKKLKENDVREFNKVREDFKFAKELKEKIEECRILLKEKQNG